MLFSVEKVIVTSVVEIKFFLNISEAPSPKQLDNYMVTIHLFLVSSYMSG